MADHYWIIEVNDRPGVWAWRGFGTARGGLDMVAYESKAAAAPDLYQARRIYKHARLRKFVPEGDENV